MHVSRKQHKKKHTKFYKLDSRNNQQAVDSETNNNDLKKLDKVILQPLTQLSPLATMYSMNELFIFNCAMSKFDQIHFNIDLHLKASKKDQSQKIGKVIIGSINYCTNIKGFTQMEQMIRDSGNEVLTWHKIT